MRPVKGSPWIAVWLVDNFQRRTEGLLMNAWSSRGARIVSKPESKPLNLHEFTAMDLDDNLFRVFYDYSSDLADRGA